MGPSAQEAELLRARIAREKEMCFPRDWQNILPLLRLLDQEKNLKNIWTCIPDLRIGE